MGTYTEERAKELRALSDGALVGLEMAALDAHADLNDDDDAEVAGAYVSAGTAQALRKALQATGACDCTPDDEQAGIEVVFTGYQELLCLTVKLGKPPQ
jgi:hypothetical protein